MTVTLAAGGPTWMAYQVESVTDFAGLPQSSQGAGVAGGAGPWWVAPEALVGAQAGAVIDEDPITGERTVVGMVSDGVVTIESAMPGLSSSGSYDTATGRLLEVLRTETSSGITTDLRLQSVR
jgi:hypothetical protein